MEEVIRNHLMCKACELFVTEIIPVSRKQETSICAIRHTLVVLHSTFSITECKWRPHSNNAQYSIPGVARKGYTLFSPSAYLIK